MGGTFNGPKILPSTYVRFKAKKKTAPAASVRGTAVVPLVGYDYGGDSAELLMITSASPDAQIAKLGRSVYADDNAILRYAALALEGAATVYLYLPAGGNKATKTTEFSTGNSLTVTAKSGGTRGNKLALTIVANPVGGFDVTILMDGESVETFEKLTTVASFAACASEYVVANGTGNLAAAASIVLTGGTDASVTNAVWSAYLDALETIKFNTALVPVSESTLKSATISKVNSLRNTAGKSVQFVCAENEGDNIGILNLVNSFGYETDKGEPDDLSIAQAAAWVTGQEAGGEKTTSLTYKIVPNATHVVGELGIAEQEAAVKDGKMFFSVDDEGNVILTYDINSLVNPDADQDDTYKKNRVIHTLDSFADDLRINIKPNQYDNSPEGWDLMLGRAKSIMNNYQADGAIKNVNLDEDITVDTARSVGDEVYFNVALQPVDSAEKIYFTVATQ